MHISHFLADLRNTKSRISLFRYYRKSAVKGFNFTCGAHPIRFELQKWFIPSRFLRHPNTLKARPGDDWRCNSPAINGSWLISKTRVHVDASIPKQKKTRIRWSALCNRRCDWCSLSERLSYLLLCPLEAGPLKWGQDVVWLEPLQ